jgi:hypothetical protein
MTDTHPSKTERARRTEYVRETIDDRIAAAIAEIKAALRGR